MKKLFLIAAICIAAYWLFGGKPGSDLPANLSPVREVPVAERTNVILFTGTEWCPPCQALERNVIDTDPWREFIRKEVMFSVYDFPRDPGGVSATAQTMAQRYQVSGFPTMVIVDRQGNRLSQKVGVAGDIEVYKRWIRSF